MTRRLRLLLLGKQGAGKGTQAVRVAEHYGIVHLSTGDIFRAAARDGTPEGLEAKKYMDEGQLVPDDLVMRVVERHLSSVELLDQGFVLDGFPRTEPQADQLNRVLAEHDHPIDLAIDLDVPTEIVLDRIAGRRVCESCGAVYHDNMPPKVDWTCDECGGHVVQRDDDTEAAVMRRLELYEQETRPILDSYREQGRLVVVDGTGGGDDVFARLVDVVDRYREPVA